MRRWPASPVALAILLGACGGATPGADPAVVPTPPGPLKVALGTAPQRGPDDAWVTVIEFSDFQCPYCRLAEPEVVALLADLPADVRLRYRHLPLGSIHPNAQQAALASECARAQGPAPDGHFWELHDALLASQPTWAPLPSADARVAFGNLASRITGLDLAAWSGCMTDQAPLDRVAADVALAGTLGVNGTPTFVVNGTRVLGVTGLRAAVDAALAWARQQTAYPRAEFYDKAVLGL